MKVYRRPEMNLVGELSLGAEVIDMKTTDAGEVIIITTDGAYIVTNDHVLKKIETEALSNRQRMMEFFMGAIYRFKHWLFRWCADEECDVTFVVAGIVGFTKYKEHTVIRWLPKLPPAHKWQGNACCMKESAK